MAGAINQSHVERDIADIGKAVNENTVVNPRSGQSFKSLPMIASELLTQAFSNTAIQENTFYYINTGTTVIKDSNPALFSIEISVKEGEKYSVNTQSFGVAGTSYITDANNIALSYMSQTDTLPQSYLLEMPENAAKLFVNCVYDYAKSFSVSKVPNSVFDLFDSDKQRKQFTYYSIQNNLIIESKHNGLFSKEFDVVENEFYEINTRTFGTASRSIITDNDGNVLEKIDAGLGGPQLYVIKMPADAAKLYVNCSYSYIDSFSAKKLTDTFLSMLPFDGRRQDITFYYASSANLVKKESNAGLFSIEINVIENDSYSVKTGTFGVAGEYYIADENGNLIASKATSDKLSDEYIVTIPPNGAKLYVNCAYAYADYFNVTRVSNTIIKKLSEADSSIRGTFPSFNYFDQLRLKCPNFYQKFKDKMQDVVVVLTGTSLTQGNLYTTDRTDALTRPAALHANDFASSVFDKLIKHWDGQKYRRYDHDDIFYSNSLWSVTTEADDWDDHTYIKNGLTKTTTDANASVSTKIPANAWQFNFVYRTNTNGCDCKIEITQGINYVEVFDGSNWVEAHNYQFSNLESAATATKGNTQYQKRLKMRCKNKAGGVNSIGTEKQMTISKVSGTGRFNVVGFEWSPREFMLSVINGARGGHEWGDPTGNRLDKWQDTDIWSFNPDLLLAEITIINRNLSE